MQNQNLFFNILTFDWPAEDQTFYFSLEDAPYVKRLHRSQFPNEIEEIFPGISTDGTEFIYTSFDGVEEGFVPLPIDFRNENADLIKSYYNDKIYSYFKFGLRQVVHTGFINESIVWLPVDKSNFFFIYERISLKIQLCTVSDFPEIVISYEGRAKVMNKPVEILIRDIPAEKFFYVLQGRSIFQYKKMSGFEEADYGTAYPLVSNELAKYLNIEVETPPKENKYIKYLRKIENSTLAQVSRPVHERYFLSLVGLRINETSLCWC